MTRSILRLILLFILLRVSCHAPAENGKERWRRMSTCCDAACVDLLFFGIEHQLEHSTGIVLRDQSADDMRSHLSSNIGRPKGTPKITGFSFFYGKGDVNKMDKNSMRVMAVYVLHVIAIGYVQKYPRYTNG